MEGTILCSRFMVKKKLGAGSFGEIFSAEDLVAHKIVAIKLESLKIRSPQLEYEARIYQIMSEGSGIPRLYFFGADQKHNVMAIDLLGKSLEDLFAHHKKPLSLKTVLMLADQMIDSIRYLHRRHFIHRDIKPDNFVMGLNQRGSFMSITCSTGNTTKNIKSINNGFHAFVENPTIEENKKNYNEENKKSYNEENKKNHNEENKKNHNEEHNLPENENTNGTHPNSNTTTNHSCNNNFIISKVTSMNASSNNANKVFMIDFGLAKRYRDPKTHSHIPFAENKSLTGTARYASINAMRGKEQSRRDDLESLGYVLIYLLKGKLPWQGLPARDQHQKMKKIADVKRNTPVEVLCDGLPHQFIEYINSVKSLKFEEEPDYAFYKALFRDLFIKEGYIYDYQYDWIISNERREKLNSDKPPEIHKSNIKFIVQPPSEEPSRVLKPFSRRYGHIRRSADKGEKLFIEPNNNKNIHDNNHNNNANNNELSGNINNNNNSNNVNMNAVVQSARTDKNAPIVAPPRMRTALPCPRLPSLPNLTPRINRPQVAPRHYQSRRVLPVGE